ncbi:MAG: hypothetical protein IRZ31_07490 [Thermogemmatispora sp.]|uniref:hypothetical protein n=1 Tax=Thermogemmatispora sp. TaxID=1968838 RepID=UPI0026154AA5|nr:hypothetical protein [Thermogemmatispora sp.]MBX5456730.1 hypothetical protein [Thermogemmatispora sp.]
MAIVPSFLLGFGLIPFISSGARVARRSLMAPHCGWCALSRRCLNWVPLLSLVGCRRAPWAGLPSLAEWGKARSVLLRLADLGWPSLVKVKRCVVDASVTHAPKEGIILLDDELDDCAVRAATSLLGRLA